MNKHFDCLVIGSGPSGLTAAARVAAAGRSVALLERNSELSKKIYATGNGRCNFANLNAPNAKEVIDYARTIGIVPFEEEGRLYPRNREARSVANALIAAAKNAGAELVTNFFVTSVQKNEQGFVVESESGEVLTSDTLVVATGGKAGISFGCYGDGYKWAESLGIALKKPIPALTGVKPEEDIALLHGTRVNARVSLSLDGEEIGSDTGEVQFAKEYISGICVMNLSRLVRLSDERKYILHIDMYPEYTKEELIDLFKSQIGKVGCAMEGLVPEKIHDYLHTRIKKDEHNPVNMAALSKDLRFNIIGTDGWKNAQVTSGGILLEELDDNYQSKKVKGLFFAGEVVDYDGPCGGYNICYAIYSGLKVGEYFTKK